MSGRTTLVLLLVAAALGGFVWWYEIRGGEQRAEAEATAKRVFGELEAEDVQAIELAAEGEQRVRVERGDGGWRMVSPVAFPADETAVNGVASALASLESEASFTEPAPLDAYGLDGEPLLRFEADGERHALRVGDETPLGGNTYVARESGETVWAVPTWRTSGLRRSAFDLRDKRLLVFDRESVQAIELAWPGERVRLERDGESWRGVAPFTGAADERSVRDLLSDLAFLRATGFVDEPPADAVEAGLAEPELEVRLELAGETGPSEARLAIGALRDGGMRVARGRAEGVLYEIPAERLDDFPRSIGAWRFRDVARFDTSEAERIELAFQDPEAGQSRVIEGRRDEEGAWVSEPEPIDPDAMTVLVSELSRLRAEGIAADSLGEDELAALELSPPRVHVRVFAAPTSEGGEGEPLADFRLGRADPERGIAAQRTDRETVFWLDYELANQIPVSLEALRNRFLAEAEEDEAEAEEPATGGEPAGLP